jgi:hypothetical protein
MGRRTTHHASILVASAAAAAIVTELLIGFSQLGWGRYVGVDYRIYMDATARWLSGGSYFLAMSSIRRSRSGSSRLSRSYPLCSGGQSRSPSQPPRSSTFDPRPGR